MMVQYAEVVYSLYANADATVNSVLSTPEILDDLNPERKALSPSPNAMSKSLDLY